MAQSIHEVMTHDPVTVDVGASLQETAKKMRDADTGAIIVTEQNRVRGILTDRDIVVRAVADGRESSTRVGEVVSEELVSLSPRDSAERAVELMRQHAVRRLPVIENDQPIGIVSIGDLAIERDEQSALADISAAEPNR